MNLTKLLELEARQDFDDVNAIRSSHVRSFFDEWIVTGLLGRGSFGNVYQIIKPQDGMTAQYCALKICQVANPEDAEIRLQEIETQKLLDGHMNAVQIEDYALISRQPPRLSYLIIRMELLEPLPEKGMTEREVVRMGIDICRVLEKCASMEPKLIHCDIKPANILVAPDGRYKLGDFGTAKTLQATMTYTGNRGTPLYMAPEVATYTGYDSRCDIFSLGYTMLTMLNGGQHPYQDAGESVDILREMYSSRKLPQLKGVGSGLMKILRKMCEPNLAARYSRASAVRRDLELYIRKKEEIERVAFLEAERQAEIARKKGKVEREKNIRIAEESLKKAQSYLDTAKNTPGGTAKRLSELENNAERASLVLRYVVGGDTLEEARRKANGDNANQEADFRSRRRWWIGGAAVLVFLTALIAVLLSVAPRSGSNEVSDEDGGSTYTYENYDDFVFALTDDRRGYRIEEYVGDETGVIYIPAYYQNKPVVEIGRKAFYNADKLEIVEIPENVEMIGEFAFADCSMLNRVIMGDDVTEIGDYAFDICRQLSSINIPEGVTHIGEGAFKLCTSLKDISLPSGLNSIGVRAFADCNITVSATESNAFYGYDIDEGVYWYVINDSEKYNDSFIFELSDDKRGYIVVEFRGDRVNSIHIPASHMGKPVVEIGRKAFYNSDYAVEVVIPDSIEKIGEFAFADCDNLIRVVIGEGVTEIGDYAFEICNRLSSINIPDSVMRIGNSAFQHTGLSRVSLPPNLRQIGVNAFGYCDITVNAPRASSFYGYDPDEGVKWIITD